MPDSPVLSGRTLVVLCLASAGWAFNFGLSAPLASLWLHDLRASDTIIGFNTGTYYFGIALTALAVPALMRRCGRRCLAAGILLSAVTAAALPWTGSYRVIFCLRWLNGAAGAASLIPLETYVNRQSAPAQRARNFGCYAFAIALGWALGNCVGLQMYASAPRLAFTTGGLAAVLAAVVVVRLPWPMHWRQEPSNRDSLAFGRNFLSFGSAWSQGFLEGGMVAFLSLYLLFLGHSQTSVAWLTSGTMLGAIAFQLPLAWIADRLGRTQTLLACYGLTAIGLVALVFSSALSWLGLWLFLVGACSGAFYPLGLAVLGERLSPASLPRASAWYLGINCCGSLIGPALTGAAMDQFGKHAVFMVGETAVVSVLLCWAATHVWFRYRPLGQDGSPRSAVLEVVEVDQAA